MRELIINKDSALLDSFFDVSFLLLNSLLYSFFQEVTAFQQDHSVEVRKFVVGFIEDAW